MKNECISSRGSCHKVFDNRGKDDDAFSVTRAFDQCDFPSLDWRYHVLHIGHIRARVREKMSLLKISEIDL